MISIARSIPVVDIYIYPGAVRLLILLDLSTYSDTFIDRLSGDGLMAYNTSDAGIILSPYCWYVEQYSMKVCLLRVRLTHHAHVLCGWPCYVSHVKWNSMCTNVLNFIIENNVRFTKGDINCSVLSSDNLICFSGYQDN